MATHANIIFPATNVKSGLENILFSASKFITHKFPHNTIKYIVIDTKDKMRDFYKILTKDKEVSNKITEIRKVPRPHMYIGYNFTNFNTEDTGLGIHPLYLYPSQYFDHTLKSYLPIFHDTERNIEIRTSNVRIKIESEIVITCQSKEEQVTIYTYLLNFIKMHYGYRLSNMKTEFLLPGIMIQSIKNIIFGENIPIENISDELDNYFKTFSAEGINPRFKNGKAIEKYYALEYKYRSVYMQLSNKPEMDEGERKDDVFDNYLIRFPLFLEMYIPINYILRTPELVAGINNVVQIGEFLFMSNSTNDDADMQVMKIEKTYNNTLAHSHIDTTIYTLIYRDQFLLSSPIDNIDIKMWLNAENMALYNLCTVKERKKLFKIFFFEDDHLLDEGDFVNISDDFIVTINDGIITSNQTIEIYRNDLEADIISQRTV